MLGVSLNGSSPHLKALVNSVVVANREAPFSSLNKVNLLSAGAAVVYGCHRQTDIHLQSNNQGNVGVGATGLRKYLRILGDGVTTVFTLANFPSLANAHDDQLGLNDANRLRTVLVVNGVPTTRVLSSATPGASEYKIAAAQANLTAKNAANAAYAVGTILELFMYDAADIFTQGPLTAGVMTEGTAYDFMVVDVADVAMFADRV